MRRQTPAAAQLRACTKGGTEHPHVRASSRARLPPVLPVLRPQVSVPDHDSITINYSGPAGAPGNTISLMSCYTNSSAANRAWRKANAVINVSAAASATAYNLAPLRAATALSACWPA